MSKRAPLHASNNFSFELNSITDDDFFKEFFLIGNTALCYCYLTVNFGYLFIVIGVDQFTLANECLPIMHVMSYDTLNKLSKKELVSRLPKSHDKSLLTNNVVS